MTEFGPNELLNCYANGVFPMSDGPDTDELFLVDPKHRAVFPLSSPQDQQVPRQNCARGPV